MSPTATDTADRTNASSELEIVLDYPDWSGDGATAESRRRFVSTLRQSMVGLGFFYLRDSPLQEVRKDLFEATREFFELSEEEKGEIDQIQSGHFRGYSRIGSEYTQSRPDNRAQIDIGIEAPEFPQSIAEPKYLRLWGPNQFPRRPPRLRSIVLQYIEAAEKVTIELTAALEAALGVTAGRLQDLLALKEKDAAFTQVEELKEALTKTPDLPDEEVAKLLPQRLPYYRMKLVQYGNQDGSNEQGVGAHRDGGWITLLATDDQPGLQVEDYEGKWLDVPLRESCILVNFGQQLERVSNGLINAATHRVSIKPSPRNRISTPYFSMPNMRAVINPISTDEMSSTVLAEWQAVQKKGRVSSVPEGDLHGHAQQSCGEMAWSGLTRSHPATFQRWYNRG